MSSASASSHGGAGAAPLPSRERLRVLIYNDADAKASHFSSADVLKGLLDAEGGFDASFVGAAGLSAAALEDVALYIQPGGDEELSDVYRELKGAAARALEAFVRRGGRFVGIALGGFLAGTSPGLGLVAGVADVRPYASTRGADAGADEEEAEAVEVAWRGVKRTTFFEGGPAFELADDAAAAAAATVLGTYSNGAVAAFVAPVGAGAVGLAGFHPEAPPAWFAEAELDAGAALVRGELLFDLIRSTLACGAAAPLKPLSAAASRPRALVYRDDGPISLYICADAVKASLAPRFDVSFVGPKEAVRALDAAALRGVALYVQPGGGDDFEAAWAALAPAGRALKDFVRGGGRYVGVCMGAYLAGHGPGLGLVDGADSLDYTEMRGAEVKNMDDATVRLSWRGAPRTVYYQGGPAFKVEAAALARGARVLATYSNGAAAAFVAPVGAGAVGLVGPHPEAPADWYEDAGFEPLDCVDLFLDLVDATAAAAAAAAAARV